ncbi:PKD domain-containing protein, partial [Vicingus serpentipes]
MTQANCGTNDGTATVAVVSGGSGDFSYLWDAAASGQTTATAVSVLASTYGVTVIDNITGCTKDTTVTVTSTTGITVTANFIQDAQCNGATDGSAYPTIVGGTAPFSFSWTATGFTQTDSILTAAAGSYTITVTDDNGCTGSDVVIIGEPTPVVASIASSTDVSCFGLTDGSATAAGTGGTGGTYSYLWDPTGQTTQTATNLDNGTYTVIVADSNSCIDSVDVIIQDGLIVTANYTIDDDQQCFDVNSFGFTNTGNTGGVTTFEWNFGDGSAVSLQENPTHNYGDTGTYTVQQIVYSGVCSDTITQTVTVDPMPIPFVTADSVLCFGGATGTIILDSITNSIGGYDYLWDAATGGQVTPAALNLLAGTYTLTVTDQNTGCSGDVSATVFEPTAVVASIVSITDETCLGANNGTATVGGAQGTGGYTYLWMPGGQTTANATGLAPGDYTAYVYDDNLCVDSVQVTINPGPMMTSTHTTVDVSCFNGTNGSIDVTVGGAPGAISYAWA